MLLAARPPRVPRFHFHPHPGGGYLASHPLAGLIVLVVVVTVLLYLITHRRR